MRQQVRTGSAEETREVGEAVASLLRPRDAVVLTGELGAGKTTFAQASPAGWASTSRSLPDVHPREGVLRHPRRRARRRLPARARPGRRRSRARRAGRRRRAPGRMGRHHRGALPDERLQVELTTDDATGERARSIVFTCAGDGWAERFPELEAALAPCGVRVIVIGIDVDLADLGGDRHGARDPGEGERRRRCAAGIGHAPAPRPARAERSLVVAGGGHRRGRGTRPVHRAARRGRHGQVGRAGCEPADRGYHQPRRARLRRPVHASPHRGRDRRPSRRGLLGDLPRGSGRRRAGRDYDVHPRLAAELQASAGEVLAVGNGAMLYRHVLEEVGSRLEVASSITAHPEAASLVELAVPRFLREEHDRLFDVVPLYLRRSDAEIAWDRRARSI